MDIFLYKLFGFATLLFLHVSNDPTGKFTSLTNRLNDGPVVGNWVLI